jgi:hypothetical protein
VLQLLYKEQQQQQRLTMETRPSKLRSQSQGTGIAALVAV